MTYNGHRNYNYWNVALWIGNDEGLYRLALDLKRELGTRAAAEAFRDMMVENARHHTSDGRPATPDGAPWTVSAIYAAMGGLK